MAKRNRPTIAGGHGANTWTFQQRRELLISMTELVLTPSQLVTLMHALNPQFMAANYNAQFKHFRDMYSNRHRESSSRDWMQILRPYPAVGHTKRQPILAAYTAADLTEFARIRATVHATATANGIPVIFKTGPDSQALGGPQLVAQSVTQFLSTNTSLAPAIPTAAIPTAAIHTTAATQAAATIHTAQSQLRQSLPTAAATTPAISTQHSTAKRTKRRAAEPLGQPYKRARRASYAGNYREEDETEDEAEEHGDDYRPEQDDLDDADDEVYAASVGVKKADQSENQERSNEKPAIVPSQSEEPIASGQPTSSQPTRDAPDAFDPFVFGQDFNNNPIAFDSSISFSPQRNNNGVAGASDASIFALGQSDSSSPFIPSPFLLGQSSSNGLSDLDSSFSYFGPKDISDSTDALAFSISDSLGGADLLTPGGTGADSLLDSPSSELRAGQATGELDFSVGLQTSPDSRKDEGVLSNAHTSTGAHRSTVEARPVGLQPDGGFKGGHHSLGGKTVPGYPADSEEVKAKVKGKRKGKGKGKGKGRSKSRK